MHNVLLVDDEPGSLESLKYLIDWEQHGFTIAGEAANGKQALELFNAHSFSVVITDIRMPLLNGMELISMLREISQVSIIIMSGYEDFEYVKQALQYGVKDYLLKPVEEEDILRLLTIIDHDIEHSNIVRKKLHWGIPAMKDQILKKWAHGNLNAEELIEQFRLLEIHTSEEQAYCALVIEMDFQNLTDTRLTESDIRLKRFAVRNIIQEVISQRGYVFEETDERYGIVLFADKELMNETDAIKLAEKIQESIANYANVMVTIGMGQIVYSLKEVAHSFYHSEKMLDRKFLLGSHVILTQDQTMDMNSRYSFKELYDIDLIVEAVKLENMNQIHSMLEKRWSQFVEKNVPEPVVKSLVVGLFSDLYRLIKERGLNEEDIFDPHGGDYERIMGEKTLAQLFAFAEYKCVSVIRYFQKNNLTQPAKTIETVKRLVNEQYHKNISMKSISEQIFMNAAYLGQLFKTVEGLAFNDYLMKVRMEKAKVLLTDKDKKVYEIALEVGYSDLDWFYKKFKQYTGVSTSEFRAVVPD